MSKILVSLEETNRIIQKNLKAALIAARSSEEKGKTSLKRSLVVRRAVQNVRRSLVKLDSITLALRERYDSTSYRQKILDLSKRR